MPFSYKHGFTLLQMRKRARQVRPRSRKADLAPGVAQERAQKASQRKAELNRELDEHWTRVDEFIEHIKSKYNLTRESAARKVNRTSKYGQKRAVSAYNAYIFCRSLELNEGGQI